MASNLMHLFPFLSIIALPTLTLAEYTVHSTFLFVRAGDHTPLSLGNTPGTLTPLGSQQLYSVGDFFRSRYLTDEITGGNNTLSGIQKATIDGLSLNLPVDEQLYLLALDRQCEIASAQAFMQGFYPPFSIMNDGNGGNLGEGDGIVTTLDGLGLLGNGTYVEAPLSGYQYPRIHVASPRDYASVYTAGSLNCPALDSSIMSYFTSPAFTDTAASTYPLYQNIGAAFLSDVLPSTAWSFGNAYSIYEYLSYLNTHNSTVYRQFQSSTSGFRSKDSSYSDLDTLRWLADSQQTALLGNTSTPYPYIQQPTTTTKGSISTIAGGTLAYKILNQFTKTISSTSTTNKLNILFGDYDPFISFFALAGLTGQKGGKQTLDVNFLGLPAPGSVMAFELFSTNSSSSSTFPQESDLYVRFLFRNGTDQDTFNTRVNSSQQGLQAYPIFGRGPSETDLMWSEFSELMSEIAVAPGEWCSACQAESLFCAAWNDTSATIAAEGGTGGTSVLAAGFIGAVIALALAGVVVLVLILAGLRVHRRKSGSGGASGLVGFKGGKLASDPDLTLKGNFFGATIERKGSAEDGSGGDSIVARERIGSWEMKDTEFEPGGKSVYSLDIGNGPVRPDERV